MSENNPASSYSLQDLLYLMARLRDPDDGCPWDRAQDFAAIAPHTIEESYELVDAIERGDYQQVKEELGDVLFQVIFYAQLGGEKNLFCFDDIVSSLVEKLIRRHPHVFPAGTLHSRAGHSRAGHSRAGHSRAGQQLTAQAQVKETWEAIKATEREHKQLPGVLDDVPTILPALTRAAKLQKRAARTGFDWPSVDGVIDKIKEELGELEDAGVRAINSANQTAVAQELGDLLFSCVNLARHLKLDPETVLRAANRKFETRFRYVEQTLIANGSSPQQATLAEMDALWDQAKQQAV